jgi:hypothetical protein
MACLPREQHHCSSYFSGMENEPCHLLRPAKTRSTLYIRNGFPNPTF